MADIDREPPVRRAAARWQPAATAWLWARVADTPGGLILTIGLAGAAVLLTLFIKIAKDVLLHDEIVGIDQHLIHQVYGMRTDLLTTVFKFFTFMGSIQAVAVFLAVIVIAGWRHRILPVAYVLALGGAVVISQTLKLLFGRLRPDQAFRLVVENGFSFPSGHTFVATVLYGLSAYLLARTLRSRAARWLVVAGMLPLIVLVGASRIYLGVHFPSDVLASMTFGSAFLCLLIAAVEINQRYRLQPALILTRQAMRPILAGLAAVILAGVSVAISH